MIRRSLGVFATAGVLSALMAGGGLNPLSVHASASTPPPPPTFVPTPIGGPPGPPTTSTPAPTATTAPTATPAPTSAPPTPTPTPKPSPTKKKTPKPSATATPFPTYAPPTPLPTVAIKRIKTGYGGMFHPPANRANAGVSTVSGAPSAAPAQLPTTGGGAGGPGLPLIPLVFLGAAAAIVGRLARRR